MKSIRKLINRSKGGLVAAGLAGAGSQAFAFTGTELDAVNGVVTTLIAAGVVYVILRVTFRMGKKSANEVSV